MLVYQRVSPVDSNLCCDGFSSSALRKTLAESTGMLELVFERPVIKDWTEDYRSAEMCAAHSARHVDGI